MSSMWFSAQGLAWLAAIAVTISIGASLSRSGRVRLFAGATDLILTAMIVALPLAAFAVVHLRAPTAPEAMRAYFGTAPVMGVQVLGVALGLAAATLAAMIALHANGPLRGVLAIAVKFIIAPACLLVLPLLLIGRIGGSGPITRLANRLHTALLPHSAP